MLGLGETMSQCLLVAAQIEHMRDPLRCWAISVSGRMTELDAVVGQDGVDLVRNGGNHAL